MSEQSFLVLRGCNKKLGKWLWLDVVCGHTGIIQRDSSIRCYKHWIKEKK